MKTKGLKVEMRALDALVPYAGQQAILDGDGRTFDEVRASRQGTSAND